MGYAATGPAVLLIYTKAAVQEERTMLVGERKDYFHFGKILKKTRFEN